MKKSIIYIIVLSFVLILTGCFIKKDRSKLNHIFSKKIGFQKDNIGTYLNEDMFEHIPFSVFYTDGFYYISDPINNKIMKLTERGFPVLTIYNPKNNPGFKQTEATTDNDSNSSSIFLNIYKEYSLIRPGLIVVDNKKNIYVINKDSNYKTTNDNGDIVDEKILKFNQNGDIVSIIGENGGNSLPFGYIYDIQCDNKNNIIVIEKQTSNYVIKQFSIKGEKINECVLKDSEIPLKKDEIGLLTTIINVKPGYDKNTIYVTVQYIKKSKSNINFEEYETLYNKLLLFSLEQKSFVKLILKMKTQTLKLSNQDSFYVGNPDKLNSIPLPMQSFLGKSNDAGYIFSQKEISLDEFINNNQILYFYTKNGILSEKSTVRFPQGMIYVADFQVSSTGKIFSYYIKDGVINFINVE